MKGENSKPMTRLFGIKKTSVLLLTILALFVFVDQSQAKSLRQLAAGHANKSRHNKPKEVIETVK